jgi:hypothetical protein
MTNDDSRDLDQEWEETLDEIRVILPGTEVLFAFLLTIPFSGRFSEISSTDRTIYFIAFICAAVATIFFIAPGVYHRLEWRQRDKEYMLQITTRLVIVGTVVVAVAVTAVVFLVSDFLYGSVIGAGVAAVIIGVIFWLWYGLALVRRLRRRRQARPE